MFSGFYQRQHQTQGTCHMQALSLSLSFALKIRTLYKRHPPFACASAFCFAPFHSRFDYSGEPVETCRPYSCDYMKIAI